MKKGRYWKTLLYTLVAVLLLSTILNQSSNIDETLQGMQLSPTDPSVNIPVEVTIKGKYHRNLLGTDSAELTLTVSDKTIFDAPQEITIDRFKEDGTFSVLILNPNDPSQLTGTLLMGKLLPPSSKKQTELVLVSPHNEDGSMGDKPRRLIFPANNRDEAVKIFNSHSKVIKETLQ